MVPAKVFLGRLLWCYLVNARRPFQINIAGWIAIIRWAHWAFRVVGMMRRRLRFWANAMPLPSSEVARDARLAFSTTLAGWTLSPAGARGDRWLALWICAERDARRF